MSADEATAAPAHRPSRRNEIIDAAVRLFARHGYVDAAISDVAKEADVVVTAVYYHFSGKEELYSAAVHQGFGSISQVVSTARPDGTEAGLAGLVAVVDAVWDWIGDHPDEAMLLYLQLPSATRQISTLRQAVEEQHARRAFKSLEGDQTRTPAAQRGRHTLTARTLLDLLISVHSMRLPDGPLSTHSADQLRVAVHRLAERLISA